ncbi:MAG TPA: PAS domain S-box protein, partial [Candidatus Obscuribacterales bacterium]
MKRDAAGKFVTNWGCEAKQRVSLSLTKTAWRLLDEEAHKHQISRSELIECYARSLSEAPSQGKVEEVVSLVSDITESKRIEEELREREQRFSTLFNGMEDWVLVYHLAPDYQPGKFIEVNEQACKILGYSRQELLTLSVADIVGSPSINPQANVEKLLANKHIVVESIHTTKDGRRIPVEVSATLFTLNGLPTVQAICRDITKRKNAEEALRKSESLYRAIRETLNYGIWVCDRNGKNLYASDSLLQLVGLTQEQYSQLSWENILHPDDAGRTIASWKECVQTEGILDIEHRFRGVDGNWHPILTRGVPVRDENGEALCWAGINLDISRLKQVEESLRRSEEQFRQLADAMPQIVWVVNADDKLEYVNKQWCNYAGLTLEEGRSREIASLVIHPDDVESVYQQWAESIATKTPYQRECRLKRASDGAYRWFLVRTMPVKDEQDRVIRWYGTSTDIDDLKRTEETLQQSEEQLRLALDSGRMGIWDWSILTGELKWSNNLEEIHGMAPGNFGGTFADFQKIIHPEDREMVNQAITQAVEQKSTYDIEFRILWADGSTHWIAGKGKTFSNAEGKAVRMIGVGMDITERKRNEEAQRYFAEASKVLSSSLDYQTTLTSVAQLTVPHLADWCVVHVIEEDGSIEQLAAAHIDPAKVKWAWEMKDKYPVNADEPRGAGFTLRTGKAELIPDIPDEALVQAARDSEHLEVLRQIGFKAVMTVPLAIQDRILGVISFVSTEESGRCYDEGDLSLAEELGRRAALAVDNARLYRGQERDRARAEAANRIKDEFLAVLSHELRTPLNPILGWTQLLKSRKFDEKRAMHALDIIERNAQLQTQLIDDLLDVSRILQGKLQLEFQPIHLKFVIEAAIETVHLAAEAKSIQIQTRFAADVGRVTGNSGRLQQVVWNLLSNAIKFTPKGGRVEIALQRVDDYAQIQVTDTGIGIEPEFLPYVFDYFRQADSKTTRTFGGLGLGLAIVRHLVELHGGTVWAESLGGGQGASFTIQLPLLVN